MPELLADRSTYGATPYVVAAAADPAAETAAAPAMTMRAAADAATMGVRLRMRWVHLSLVARGARQVDGHPPPGRGRDPRRRPARRPGTPAATPEGASGPVGRPYC